MYPRLTTEDMSDVLTTRLVPVASPAPGMRCLYRAKVGGEAQLITVCVKRVFRAPCGKGRTSLYADVHGYGFRGHVQTKKLLKQEKMGETPKGTAMQDLIGQILDLQAEIAQDMEKYQTGKHGWKAAAARARKNTLALAKLHLRFRAESVAAEKQSK